MLSGFKIVSAIRYWFLYIYLVPLNTSSTLFWVTSAKQGCPHLSTLTAAQNLSACWDMFKSTVFWERNNLEISVFESHVVRLRTGKMALNTFKNIHLQSNISESSKEGSGWWPVPAMCATSSGVAGGLGTLGGLRPRQASGRRLPSWPQCLWPSFNKGKGRLVLPSVKSNLSRVHLEAGPAGGAEGPSILACGKDSSSVLPGSFSPSF